MKVFSVAEMVVAEKAAVAAGHGYDDMMEAAGKAVAAAVQDRLAVAGRSILILVGPGNNGGDGLVAGRYLAEAGADVAFYLVKRDQSPDDAGDPQLARVRAMGLQILAAPYDLQYRVLRHRLAITDVLIDALLGTGVSRPVSGELATVLRQVAGGVAERRQILDDQARPARLTVGAWRRPAPAGPLVVAVDCPSGLNCDSGALDPLALAADLTVTFAGPKRGHFLFPGASAAGELVVADIGIEASLPEVKTVSLELATAPAMAARLPARPPDGHKGTFGRVLIAAGSGQYWGAPVLAGRAALRAGAGLVALAVPEMLLPTTVAQLPEATYPAVAERETLGAATAQHLAADASSYKAILAGPGLGAAADFLLALLNAGRTARLPPLVLDADALNQLAAQPDWPDLLPAGAILTPHPGEMARLVGLPLAEVQTRDRIALAQTQAQAWGQVVLLKGAYTVVAAPDGRTALLPFANPLLAVAGSGDVLAGVIVALLGQGLEPYNAAVLGGFLHGAAGAYLAGRLGSAGLLVRELADALPVVRRGLEGELTEA